MNRNRWNRLKLGDVLLSVATGSRYVIQEIRRSKDGNRVLEVTGAKLARFTDCSGVAVVQSDLAARLERP